MSATTRAFENGSSEITVRIGVVVRVVMAKHEWFPASKRGLLTGLSKWFERTERYMTWIDV